MAKSALKNIANLKQQSAPVPTPEPVVETTPTPVVETPAPAEEIAPKAKKVKKEKAPVAEGTEPKKRGNPGNLVPKVKDPEKAKLEEETKAGIEKLLVANPAGVTATFIIDNLFDTTTPEDKSQDAKFVRSLCRRMGLVSVPVEEGSNKVKYKKA